MSDRLIVKAGRYVVGDPSAVIPCTQDWLTLMQSADHFDSADVGYINGYPVYGVRTSSAGVYHNTNQGYSVQTTSGILGLVAEALALQAIGKCGVTDQDVNYTIVEFAQDVPFLEANEDEEIVIGHLTIYPGITHNEWRDSTVVDLDEEDEGPTDIDLLDIDRSESCSE